MLKHDLLSYLTAPVKDIRTWLNATATKKGRNSWLVMPPQWNKTVLVAHIDTVLNTPKQQDIIGNDTWLIGLNGLGADDRAGMYVIKEVLRRCQITQQKKLPALLYTDKEESGLIGAYEASKLYADELQPANYLIEADRRGTGHFVTYNNDQKEFCDWIKNLTGWQQQRGSVSDIKVLGKALKKCAVNIATGYYYEHTLYERVNKHEVNKCIDVIYRVITNSNQWTAALKSSPEKDWFTDSLYSGYADDDIDFYTDDVCPDCNMELQTEGTFVYCDYCGYYR